MHIEHFKPEDALAIRDIALDWSIHGDGTVAAWAIANYNMGPCYTGIHEGAIVGVAGVRIVRPGIGHLWAAFTPLFRKNLITCYRCLWESMLILEDQYSLKHLRTLSKLGFPGSQTLIEHMGFSRRRLIKSIGQYLYVRRTWES